MEKNGFFVISLDFELIWGVFDKVNHSEKVIYFENTRRVIPKILDLFEEFEISCTWAAVGMLLNENWKEWENNHPKELPAYKNQKLSPYQYGQNIKSNKTEKLCFAPHLIRMISETPRQELATHTYSHYYCSENGQTISTFRADLKKAVSMSRSMGVEISSLVFPRNQLNPEYLKVCTEYGIRTVRSNPSNWYWRETEEPSVLKKIFRTGDAYFGLKDKSYPFSNLKKELGRPLEQKASRLLRPHSENKFLNRVKVHRIKSEMRSAARKNEIYHLWWHPHNFGNHPEKNLEDLRELLLHYRKLKDKYSFESASMKDIFSLLKHGQHQNI